MCQCQYQCQCPTCDVEDTQCLGGPLWQTYAIVVLDLAQNVLVVVVVVVVIQGECNERLRYESGRVIIE